MKIEEDFGYIAELSPASIAAIKKLANPPREDDPNWIVVEGWGGIEGWEGL